MFFVIWNVFLNFYFTHVEKYNTGVMFLPWGYDFTMWVRTLQINYIFYQSYNLYNNYILFSVKGVSLMLFVATLVGPEIYRSSFYGFTVANMFEVGLIGSGILSSHPIIIRNIYLFVL